MRNTRMNDEYKTVHIVTAVRRPWLKQILGFSRVRGTPLKPIRRIIDTLMRILHNASVAMPCTREHIISPSRTTTNVFSLFWCGRCQMSHPIRSTHKHNPNCTQCGREWCCDLLINILCLHRAVCAVCASFTSHLLGRAYLICLLFTFRIRGISESP